MNPLEETPKSIRPLGKSLWDINCSVCDKPWARWCSGGTTSKSSIAPVCSICFLYKSAWGAKNGELIRWGIEQAETACGKPLAKDDCGRLFSPQDGDRLLAALAMSFRVTGLQTQAQQRKTN